MLKTDEDLKEQILCRLDRPIVLVGLMGAGKTRLGRMIARALNLDFVDSDDEIEQAAGYSVAEVFERFGEPYFRDGEKRIIKRLVDKKTGVVSTGGGAVMTPETADIIYGETVSVWVKADMATTLTRVSRNIAKRPILAAGDPEKILQELMEKRYPVYEKADILLQSGEGAEANIVLYAMKELYRVLYHENWES